MIYKGTDFETKLAKIKKAGIQELHVISDFDKTLSKQNTPYGKYKSTIALIRDGEYLTDNYPQRARNLFQKYHPYEIDPSLPLKEKREKMMEWWTTHLDLMIECGMSKEVIDDIVLKENIVLRKGYKNLFSILYKYNIPFLIFSAGIGDIIKGKLEKVKLNTPNVHILANIYTFDSKDKVTGYESSVVHSFNKDEGQVKGHPYANEVNKRSNVILLGDSLGDVLMAQGMTHDTILRVGFYNSLDKTDLDTYRKAYDIVITGDGAITPVVKILKEII